MNTGIRTDRIEIVREIVSGMLEQAPEASLRASGYVHMFGVAEACVLLAMKRGEDVELAAVAGYLHDIASYTTGSSADHARRGAEMSGKFCGRRDFFRRKRSEKFSAQSFSTAIKRKNTGASMRFSKTLT